MTPIGSPIYTPYIPPQEKEPKEKEEVQEPVQPVSRPIIDWPPHVHFGD